MKNKKLLLPAIILAVAVFAIAVCSVLSSIAKKPAVTEGEFPFSITYELDGETVTIRDVYKVHYAGNGGYADTKHRTYVGEVESLGKNQTVYMLKEDGQTRIELWTHFYPDHMMGDPDGDHFEEEAFEPKIYYYDAQENEFHDEETLAAQGVKLIGYEYPTPIENSLVFSHFSYLSASVVPLLLLVAAAALVAILIFVKKEKDLQYKPIDVVSIVLNWLVGTLYLAFVSILSMLIDVDGGNPDFYYQMLYFIPSFSLLCVAASIALRRKGYGVVSLITGLIGPAVFGVYLTVCGLCGWL